MDGNQHRTARYWVTKQAFNDRIAGTGKNFNNPPSPLPYRPLLQFWKSTSKILRYPVTSFTMSALVMLLFLSSSAYAQPKFTGPTTSMVEAGYEWIDKAKGVDIYYKESKQIVHVAARGVIEATPERITEALLDYESQVESIKRVSDSRILKRGDNWMLVYQHLNLPVIDDRDYVLLVKWSRKNGTTSIAYKAVTDKGPRPKEGLVRVTTNWGLWQLTPLADGKGTEVRFQTMVDMGGLLPYWLVRPGTASELPQLYENLRDMLN